MKQSKVIGITGGVGSGKSTVLSYAEENYPCEIIRADEVGRELMEPGQKIYDILCAHYGTAILQPDGRIDRRKLAELAFSTEESQKEINRLEHPLIRAEIIRRIEESRKPLLLLEAALLKEGDLVPLCDEVWYIYVPEEIRMERIMASRGYSSEKCMALFSRQLSDEEFRSFSDVIIDNGKTTGDAEAQVDQEMKRLGIIHAHTGNCQWK